MDEDKEEEEERNAENASPVRDSPRTGRDDLDDGREEVPPDIFSFMDMTFPGRYKEGPVQDDYEPGRIFGVIEGESRTTIKPNRYC